MDDRKNYCRKLVNEYLAEAREDLHALGLPGHQTESAIKIVQARLMAEANYESFYTRDVLREGLASICHQISCMG
jgi:hypothetical protein